MLSGHYIPSGFHERQLLVLRTEVVTRGVKSEKRKLIMKTKFKFKLKDNFIMEWTRGETQNDFESFRHLI